MSMADTSGSFTILSGLGGAKGAGSIGSGLTSIGGAASDLFAAQGDEAESSNYTLAASLAGKNAQYSELSTGIKNMQADREIYQTIGKESAGVASSGFSAGGSAGDLLRSSASQGALTHAVTSAQGLIQEQGYQEQQQSYQTMASAASTASIGADISGGIKGAVGLAEDPGEASIACRQVSVSGHN